jgi:hypothetical protein
VGLCRANREKGQKIKEKKRKDRPGPGTAGMHKREGKTGLSYEHCSLQFATCHETKGRLGNLVRSGSVFISRRKLTGGGSLRVTLPAKSQNLTATIRRLDPASVVVKAVPQSGKRLVGLSGALPRLPNASPRVDHPQKQSPHIFPRVMPRC